jgi:hypothetical protein
MRASLPIKHAQKRKAFMANQIFVMHERKSDVGSLRECVLANEGIHWSCRGLKKVYAVSVGTQALRLIGT